MKTLLKNRELSALLAILALFVVLVALNPAYLSLQTLGMIFASAQILILLALGAGLVMLTRNIDVSVGSIVGLCAIAVGVALNNGYGLPVAILFALAIGAVAALPGSAARRVRPRPVLRSAASRSRRPGPWPAPPSPARRPRLLRPVRRSAEWSRPSARWSG